MTAAEIIAQLTEDLDHMISVAEPSESKALTAAADIISSLDAQTADAVAMALCEIPARLDPRMERRPRGVGISLRHDIDLRTFVWPDDSGHWIGSFAGRVDTAQEAIDKIATIRPAPTQVRDD